MIKKQLVLPAQVLGLVNVLAEYPNMELSDEHRSLLAKYREEVLAFLSEASLYAC